MMEENLNGFREISLDSANNDASEVFHDALQASSSVDSFEELSLDAEGMAQPDGDSSRQNAAESLPATAHQESVGSFEDLSLDNPEASNPSSVEKKAYPRTKVRLSREELRQVRMMLAIVGNEERRQLQEKYPQLLEEPEEKPEILVPVAHSLLQVQLGDDPEAIDFGLNGCRFTYAEFIGLRQIPGLSLPSSAQSFVKALPPSALLSPRAQSGSMLTNIRTSINNTWQRISDPKATSKSLSKPSATSAFLPTMASVARSSESSRADGLTASQSQTSDGSQAMQRRASAPSVAGSAATAAGAGSRESSSHGAGGGVPGGAPAVLLSAEEREEMDERLEGMECWELLWKEPSIVGAPARRMQMACNPPGIQLIRSRIESWHSAVQSPSAMMDASLAVMRAHGGRVPEDPHYAGKQGEREGGEAAAAAAVGAAGSGVSSPHHANANGGADGNGTTAKGSEGHTGGDTASASAAGSDGDGSAVQEWEEEGCEMRWGSVVVRGKFLPDRDGDSLLLTTEQIKGLAAALPARVRYAGWKLHYSTARDGISLATLYRKTARKNACLLVVRDTKKHVFGCFASEAWKVGPRYYGNGECFVFQVHPSMIAYRWTRANSFFMLSNDSMLAIGGGDHYAILLRESLLSGYSGECATFGNPMLASEEEFEVAQVEVWGL